MQTQTELNQELIYKTIINLMKDKDHWKNPTRTFKTDSIDQANLVQEVLNYFLGGSELNYIQDHYEVKSKGYYYYIGS